MINFTIYYSNISNMLSD